MKVKVEENKNIFPNNKFYNEITKVISNRIEKLKFENNKNDNNDNVTNNINDDNKKNLNENNE